MLSSDVLIICFLSLHRIIWKTYQTLRITSALLKLKNKKTNPPKELCIDLEFQTDRPLADSIITLCTPYYLSLIICFLFIFPIYASILPSKFTQFLQLLQKPHAVFICKTAMLFVHSKHSLSTPIRKTCQQSHNVNDVTFATRKHMSPEGPIFVAYCLKRRKLLYCPEWVILNKWVATFLRRKIHFYLLLADRYIPTDFKLLLPKARTCTLCLK